MWLTHALRSLRRTPSFTAAAAFTLALGIGSAGAAFAIAYGLVLQPLPYGRPDRLVSIGLQTAELQRIQQPPAVFHTYSRLARSLAGIGFHRTGNANLTATDGIADPERVTATWVTASTIPLLQVAPLLGRSFTEAEDQPGAPDVAVISEAVWRTFFHASPDAIGKTLIVNSVPRTIIGVMPRQFMFPSADTRLWLPARLDRDMTAMTDFAYSGVGRLASGTTPEEAERELVPLLSRMAESYPGTGSGTPTAAWLEQARPAPVVVPLREEITRGIARTLWMLAAAAGLVLFVALANVTNLMMIRADARQSELAVRQALGASRLRISTHFLGETVVLTAFAGGAAPLASWAAVRALVVFGPADLPRLAELRVSASAVAFIVGVSFIAAIICTVVPTVRIQRSTLSVGLRDGGRGGTAGRVRQRLRATIAASQIAVALVAVAGSVLLLRTYQRLSQVQSGFDAENVATIWTQLPFARYGDSASVAFYSRLTESVTALPGVVSAGVTTRLPLAGGETRQLSFARDDGQTLSMPVVTVDSGYFSSLKIPVLAGAGFRRLGVQRSGEIVISRRAAEFVLGDTMVLGAVGRRLALAPPGAVYTIVGVVGDVRDTDLGSPPSPTAYVPQAVPIEGTAEIGARRSMALVVRTHGPAAGVVAPIRTIVRELDPTIPIFNVEMMSGIVRASTARLSFTLALMSVAAAITLVLGAIGLYGVMTYMVALRTREFGIRIAIGADPAQLARSVASGGMKLVAGGVAAGMALCAITLPFLRAMVHDVTPADPVTLAGATVVLVATAVLAIWFPARRASRIDPTVALRAE